MLRHVIVLSLAIGAFAPAAFAQQLTVVKGIFACRDRDTFFRLVQYAHDNERSAFNRLHKTSIASGECVHLSPGEIAFMVERTVLTVEIRRQGADPTGYWTDAEAVR
jgi:hypothetical protein